MANKIYLNGILYSTDEVSNSYNPISNKPSINGNVLIGNKTGAQLGLIDTSALANKLGGRGFAFSMDSQGTVSMSV